MKTISKALLIGVLGLTSNALAKEVICTLTNSQNLKIEKVATLVPEGPGFSAMLQFEKSEADGYMVSVTGLGDAEQKEVGIFVTIMDLSESGKFRNTTGFGKNAISTQAAEIQTQADRSQLQRSASIDCVAK